MQNGKQVECSICENKLYRTKREIKNSKSKKYFCNRSCQTKWRNTVFMGSKHKNWKNGESTYRDVLMRSKVLQICRLCKNVDTRVLAVHHVDHNHKNNQISNLVWLCHNCHHEVHYDRLGKQKFEEMIKK